MYWRFRIVKEKSLDSKRGISLRKSVWQTQSYFSSLLMELRFYRRANGTNDV